jgi:hypothetical protein
MNGIAQEQGTFKTIPGKNNQHLDAPRNLKVVTIVPCPPLPALPAIMPAGGYRKAGLPRRR